MRFKFAIVAFIGGLLWAPRTRADDEPSFADRFLYGGEVSASYGRKDTGYFNATEYQRNNLRLFRLNFALEFQASETLSILSEIRTDNLDRPEPYALYVRFHPWVERAFDVQVGRIPPVFGAFSRRRYDYDNPLIGYPLAYQYPSLVRADAAPAEVEELLERRGSGARLRYPLGDPTVMAGLPISNPLRWDTGVSVKLGRDPLELAVAFTQGTISNPRVRDDNEGKQWAARLGWRPLFGAVVGFSGARGEYVSDEVLDLVSVDGHRRSADQTSFGLDAELSRGHWLVRAEGLHSRWDAPTIPTGPLDALGLTFEARYKLSPGFYVAARVDRLTFGDIDTSDGPVSWDAPVTRWEVGLGYNFHRQVLAKFSFQFNERDGGRETAGRLPAVQVLFWF